MLRYITDFGTGTLNPKRRKLEWAGTVRVARLTQKAMSELFMIKIPAVSKHLSNIFESGELQKEATLSILETVQK